MARQCLLRPGRVENPADAVRLVQRALNLNPNWDTLWDTMGLAHYRAGDDRDAIDAHDQGGPRDQTDTTGTGSTGAGERETP